MTSASPIPIRDMFNELVPGYDRFNRLSSLGLDVHWRKELVRSLGQKEHVLDVGTGTGDVALAIAETGARVTGVDFSGNMIRAAASKAKDIPSVEFKEASADQLPFDDDSFDGLTSAFVIRNLNHGGLLNASFREFRRVLRPGGLMVHLELARPPRGVMAWGHQFYLRSILPVIGKVVFKSKWPEGYLKETIGAFPAPTELCQRIRWAGFENVSHYPLTGGIASLFCAVKST